MKSFIPTLLAALLAGGSLLRLHHSLGAVNGREVR
jgi:hypothetical protein